MRVPLYSFLVLMISFVPLKSLTRYFTIASPALLALIVVSSGDFRLHIIGESGVSLVLDEGSRYFLILTSLVYTGVALYRFKEDWGYIDQFLFLSSFATLSLTYMSNDLFNLYVMMEVLSIQAGLMVFERLERKSLWAALKYLIIGNIGANLFLIGVGMIYSKNGTFEISKIACVSEVSTLLMVVGLLIRGGSFLFGMWLPPFHSSAPSSFSALHSTVFVESTVYVLHRLSKNPAIFEKLLILKILAPFLVLGGALLTLSKVKFKDVLAASTMSHLGLMVGNPLTAPIYAFAHGISKAPLFLFTGKRSVGGFERFFVYFFIASLIGTPFTFEEFVEHELVKNFPFLELSALVGGGILGYSLMTRLSFERGNFSIFSFYFGSIAAALSITHFEGLHATALIPPILAFIMIRFGKRRMLKTLEILERFEVNLSLIVLSLGVIVWVGSFL